MNAPHDRPLIIPSEAASEGSTVQTPGFIRLAAIAEETVGTKKIWFGFFRNFPGPPSGAHHHGEAETAAYIMNGYFRVHYGTDYQEFVECTPGHFLYVPPYLPHYEVNDSDGPAEGIVARGPGNIVVPL